VTPDGASESQPYDGEMTLVTNVAGGKRSAAANRPARSDKKAATSEVMKTVQNAHVNYILHCLHLIDPEVNFCYQKFIGCQILL